MLNNDLKSNYSKYNLYLKEGEIISNSSSFCIFEIMIQNKKSFTVDELGNFFLTNLGLTN